MATYYTVPVHWRDGSKSDGRGIGNNAAWTCRCGGVLLGPHEGLYGVPPCPGCGRTFRVHRGQAPQFVSRVQER